VYTAETLQLFKLIENETACVALSFSSRSQGTSEIKILLKIVRIALWLAYDQVC
jgi:hypothetical protein